MNKLKLSLLCLLALFFTRCTFPEPPVPFGAVPTPYQLDWQKLEYYMFIHFGPNTFTNVEWGDGREDPKVFYPTAFDARQWAATAKNAGMKAIIITAKHHDGFCLWPSNYSTHTVRESLWRDGKGDVLKDLSEACKEFGLHFGVYLSPWDQNHPAYGTDEYNKVFASQLTEVLTNYGHIFEVWFDGAMGEGPDGRRQVYDWDLFNSTVLNLQPHAIIFSDVGPGCRWMGNERGVAGETNWSTMNIEGFAPGIYAPPTQILNEGEEGGAAWVPAETDVSIRPGWFYSPQTDNRVKSLAHVVDIFYTSIGRNSNLLFNIPPDHRGLIHPNDSTRLMEMREIIDQTFAENLAKKAKISANQTRGDSKRFAAKNLINSNFHKYWATDDGQLTATIEIDLRKPQTFNRLELMEYIPLGQRVREFSIEYFDGSEWKHIKRQTTIGYKRILRFPLITTQKLRVHIEDALASPVLNGIGIYRAPEILAPVRISRNRLGTVFLSCESRDAVVVYTTDGSEPDASSTRYTEPFSLPAGGTVLSKAFVENFNKSSETAREDFDIAPTKWSVVSPEGANISRTIDGNPQTSVALPEGQVAITINLGEELSLNGFSYYPVYSSPGNIYIYNFYTSSDGRTWNQLLQNATFDNIQNNPIPQFVRFEQPVNANFIRLESVQNVEAGRRTTIGEIGVITK